jgi:hypothetical protein
MNKKNYSKYGAAAGGAIGAGAGVAGAGAIVTAAGTGTGAVCTTTGLVALGGTLLGGITVTTAIPLAAGVVAGGVGYAVAKGIEKACEHNRKTLGGKVWWTDLKNVNGWRLQQNNWDKHCRIIDRNDVRHAYGSEAEMRRLFNSIPKR